MIPSTEPRVYFKGMWLTRKQAIMENAIPRQIHFMCDQGYPPTWEMFSMSTGWKETIDNLELTKDERSDYEERWGKHLSALLKKLGFKIERGKLMKEAQ